MSAADLSYRERALRAEALVGELQAVLAEYRRQELRGRHDGEDEAALRRLTERIRPHLPRGDCGGAAGVVARLLNYMLDRAGRLCSRTAILQAIGTRDLDDYESDHLVAVAVCHARTVLRAVGLGDAIATAWGRGYELRAEHADALRAWCDGRAA